MNKSDPHSTRPVSWDFVNHANTMIDEMLNQSLKVSDPEADLLDPRPTSFKEAANRCFWPCWFEQFDFCRRSIAYVIGREKPGDHALFINALIVLSLHQAQQRPERC